MTGDATTLTLPIATRRLHLRDYTKDDVAVVQAYVNDPVYWEHHSVEPPKPEQISALVQWAVQEQAIKPRLNHYLAAVRKDSKEIVGEAVLRITNAEARQAEIGFGISPKLWRQGYATEIGQALLEAAFTRLKMHRVVAQCAPENKPSIRVLQKLGLAREGLMRDVVHARGRWWSSALYSILENEYAKIKGVQGR